MILRDPRDRPLLAALIAPVVLLPFFAAFYLSSFKILAGAIYLFLFLTLMGRFTLAVHNVVHRPVFHHPRLALGWIYFIGIFLGHAPFSFRLHHVLMHHAEQNGEHDRSSTLHFKTDSIGNFLRYLTRFIFCGGIDTARYHWQKGNLKEATLAGVGEAILFGAIALFPTLLAPVVCIMRFVMAAGNWGQHAFVDPAHPTDPYLNSITCINTPYNARGFNDGYHLTHHLKPRLHWTELPAEFERNRNQYLRKGAVIVKGIDQFQIFMLLMSRGQASVRQYQVRGS